MSECGARPRTLAQLNGVLVLNKPSGPSSAQHIALVRRAFGQKKIGHAGTLDPLATGVLVVLLGQATKLSGYLMGAKVYSGVLKLGETTDTWDVEGTTVSRAPTDNITPDMVERELEAWRGTTEQDVPPFSAAKHEGVPLYRLARAGAATPRKTKRITIEFVRMLACELPFVRFRVGCGSGTYIRSLAHSLGTRLGCGAVLCELTREYSHPFALANAHTLSDIPATGADLAERVVPIADALADYPCLTVPPFFEEKVRNGAALSYAELIPQDKTGSPLPFVPDREALFVSANGEALCLAKTAEQRGVQVWRVSRGLWM